ncbi:MAG: tripartite tricarboxylate transporter permease, partial [Hyphomicrobiaceae bacterium]|nr:tripartite tricarboxylate transporter permease [Hyphomicrobiaceae bacterium]
TPAALMAYGLTKSFADDPEKFGKGEIRGVAAPEAANNAASTGSMLPMMTLGIPGSPTTAILLGGMVIWGLTPGPLLFIQQSEFVWGLTASLYAANFVTVILNLALIPLFVWVLRMPFMILAPLIFVLCFVGSFAPDTRMFDPWLVLLFGFIGYVMRKLDYPLAPLVLAIVLGPLAEDSFRQTMIADLGDWTVFFTRPLAGAIMFCAVLLFVAPLLKNLRRKKPKATAA